MQGIKFHQSHNWLRENEQHAREYLLKIKETFGSDYIGIIDKKVYIWGNAGNERVQIAISLTCPKTSASVSTTEMINFEDNSEKNLEFTKEEEDTIAKLLERMK